MANQFSTPRTSRTRKPLSPMSKRGCGRTVRFARIAESEASALAS